MNTTKTLNALNDTRTVTPNKYVWGEFTPDVAGVGYKELPVQTEVVDTSTATLAIDVGGPSLVSISVDTLRKLVGTNIPIGLILNYSFLTTTPPTGFWWLDGSEFPNAQSAIPQFVNKLIETNASLPDTNKLIVSLPEWQEIYGTYGSCGKFAWNGSSLKFPAINCFIQGLTSISDLGKLIEAGLPNHLHAFGHNSGNNNGSFVGTSEDKNYNFGSEKITRSWNGSGGGGGLQQASDPYQGNMVTTLAQTDNSNEDGVYGRSDTVQPQSIKFPYIISIYNTIAHQDIGTAIETLQFVKWVDALPETGESKYIYAVPREETDTDGKQIAALYLWDGSAWRGAGAFSLNIDPTTLATKSELAGYLPVASKAVANGVASLDANAKVPENQLPDSVTYQAILREW